MTTRTRTRTWLTTLFGIGSLLLAAGLVRSVPAPRRRGRCAIAPAATS